MSNDKTLQDLLNLRALTDRMGCLHELQVVQLKNWPWVLFNNLTRFDVVPDVKTKIVEFRFSLSKTKKMPKDSKKRFDALNEWVKTLLGNDWLIKVVAKKKALYVGLRK